MTKITNHTNISLPLAVWLLNDEYDYNNKPNVISTTTLLKPIRELVLSMQMKKGDAEREVDISSFIASKLGTAIHDSCEKAWNNKENVEKAFKALKLGSVYKNVLINPEEKDVKPDSILVYTEQRSHRELGNWIISGKYDLVMDAKVYDYKSTSTWSYVFGSKAEEYIQQGSIYRWLNPKVIKDAFVSIETIFTDWSKSEARKNSSYPQSRVHSKDYPLMSLEETKQFILNKLNLLDKYLSSPQKDLPECTKKELWQKDTVWKYYKNPEKTARATKNFDSFSGAQSRLIADKSVGIVKEIPGKIVRCEYCSVSHICMKVEEFKLLNLID